MEVTFVQNCQGFFDAARVFLAALALSSLAAAAGAAEIDKTGDALAACAGIASERSSERREEYQAIATSIASDPFYRAISKRLGAPQSCSPGTSGGDDDDSLSLIYSFAGGSLTTRVQSDIELSEQRLQWRGLSESDAERLLRAEEKAAASPQGCGIAWQSPKAEKSPDGSARTVTYRGRTCNCQAGKVYEGTVLTTLFFRSAC